MKPKPKKTKPRDPIVEVPLSWLLAVCDQAETAAEYRLKAGVGPSAVVEDLVVVACVRMIAKAAK